MIYLSNRNIMESINTRFFLVKIAVLISIFGLYGCSSSMVPNTESSQYVRSVPYANEYEKPFPSDEVDTLVIYAAHSLEENPDKSFPSIKFKNYNSENSGISAIRVPHLTVLSKFDMVDEISKWIKNNVSETDLINAEKADEWVTQKINEGWTHFYYAVEPEQYAGDSYKWAAYQEMGLVFESTREEEKIYPLFKPNDWLYKDGAVYSHFLGVNDEKIPLIAYVYDRGDNYQFLLKSDTKANIDKIHGEALTNLCEKNIESVNFNPYVLTASGADFSSEMLLCTEFLQEAQRKLDTDQIWVFSPRRTVIYIAAADMPVQERNDFFYLSLYTYKDDSFGNAPISDTFFKFEDGEFVGLFKIEENE